MASPKLATFAPRLVVREPQDMGRHMTPDPIGPGDLPWNTAVYEREALKTAVAGAVSLEVWPHGVDAMGTIIGRVVRAVDALPSRTVYGDRTSHRVLNREVAPVTQAIDAVLEEHVVALAPAIDAIVAEVTEGRPMPEKKTRRALEYNRRRSELVARLQKAAAAIPAENGEAVAAAARLIEDVEAFAPYLSFERGAVVPPRPEERPLAKVAEFDYQRLETTRREALDALVHIAAARKALVRTPKARRSATTRYVPFQNAAGFIECRTDLGCDTGDRARAGWKCKPCDGCGVSDGVKVCHMPAWEAAVKTPLLTDLGRAATLRKVQRRPSARGPAVEPGWTLKRVAPSTAPAPAADARWDAATRDTYRGLARQIEDDAVAESKDLQSGESWRTRGAVPPPADDVPLQPVTAAMLAGQPAREPEPEPEQPGWFGGWFGQ